MLKSTYLVICAFGLFVLVSMPLHSQQIDPQKADTVDQWFYTGERDREQFHPPDFSAPNDPSIVSVQRLWYGKDEAILYDPLEEHVISEEIVGGIRYKEFFFTSRTVSDGKIRVYAKFAAPDNDKALPAVLHIHGGGQTIGTQWLEYFAKNGYAVLSIDYCGNWENRPIVTTYPESLKYGNHSLCTNNAAEGNSEHNSWYEWTYLCRRALTCLASQQEVDPERMGIFGISMGGTLCWMVSGTDSRVKASVPIYGAGYDYEYRNYPYYAFKTYEPRTAVKRYLHAISSEACAPFVKAPTLFLNASNDFHGHLDWSCKTYDGLPVDTIRRISISPSYNHHITIDQNQNLILWLDAHLKGKGIFPLNPRITITKSDSNAKMTLFADPSQEIEYVKIFAALENTEAFTRYWQEMDFKSKGHGMFSTEMEIMDASKYLFSYASVKYKTGHHLSTAVAAMIPHDIGIVPTNDLRSCVIYTASERERGWAISHLLTDPIPMPDDRPPLSHGEQGGVFAYHQVRSMVTFRLSDPRFVPKSNQSRLKFTFSATANTDIVIKLENHAYSGIGTYLFSQKIGPEHSTFETGCDQFTKGGSLLDSWSIVPVLLIENTSPSAVLMQIEWIE